MFNIDINNPIHQAMIEEYENDQLKDERCPECGHELMPNYSQKTMICTNPNCDYQIRVRIRR